MSLVAIALVVSLCAAEEVIEGAVRPGESKYYQINHQGNFIISLTHSKPGLSIIFNCHCYLLRLPASRRLIHDTGDANLHVSDRSNKKPGPGTSNYTSASAGTEVLFVPASLARPVHLAVSGQWPYNTSYALTIDADLAPGKIQVCGLDFSCSWLVGVVVGLDGFHIVNAVLD